ncbi:hypothetical protein BpHYR1_014509 [Brachionus plicatilis]|uniref:Uncharacterized protein n=1 Tax=Brachionus plicatilis TaxID=10195 RepID=A0A3M7QGM3_BRAPC|nr:hypothetical protein BpHYR1_014509 [Brachionus plicatilis]
MSAKTLQSLIGTSLLLVHGISVWTGTCWRQDPCSDWFCSAMLDTGWALVERAVDSDSDRLEQCMVVACVG